MKIIRSIFRSRGGLHPRYHKDSAASPIENGPLPSRLSVCMSQHLGAPAKPLVAKGNSVARGQIIGESGGFISAPIHAPTSGKVVSIGEKPAFSGRPVTFIDIESDGEDKWVEGITPHSAWKELDGKKLIELIAGSGVVGMGGAGFPTHVKLSPPPAKPIDVLIINGAECEPYLTADHRLMVEDPDRIWSGIEIAKKILNVRRVVVAIEDNKPDAIKAMERVMAGTDAELVILKSEYPQGAEKQLIYSVTGRETPSGGLPMDVGALVENVATCAAIHDAIVEGRPLIDRITTVCGSLVKSPKNLRVRIGTAFSDLVDFCGGLSGAPAGKIICGGPMMGLAQSSLDASATKTTSGILLLERGEVEQFSSMPCISCGRCVQACPMSLMPCTLSELIEAENYDGAEVENVMDCIECGSCAHECTAHRPLVQHMRQAKAVITAQRRVKEAATKGGKQGV